jgi:hypothetical protein
VPSAQQLTTYGDARLDVTPSSIACQYEFHRGDPHLPLAVRAAN